MLIDRRILRSLDGWLVFAAIGMILYGLLAVYSATQNLSAGNSQLFERQIIWTVIGIFLMTVVLSFDYRYFGRLSRVLYLGSVASLVMVAIAGYTSMGAQRWIPLGPIPFQPQPSEFAKVAIIITLAKHLEQKENFDNWRSLISPLVHVGFPMLLILAQPDLGSTIIFAGIALGMFYVAGAKVKHLAVLCGGSALTVVLAAVVSKLQWLPLLKDYQLTRMLVFLNPEAYRYGEGYNVIQSMIAIGSGRFFGKGLFGGSQTQLSFLPARHTDFIFSVVGEELGFIGAAALLALYFIFLWRAINTILDVDNRFGRLLVAGVFSLFLSHLIINVGMSLGVMPVTGKPLPFFSYGGSSTMATFLALGILCNVNMRRRKIHF